MKCYYTLDKKDHANVFMRILIDLQPLTIDFDCDTQITSSNRPIFFAYFFWINIHTYAFMYLPL